MERNLTIEELAKVHELGEKAMKVANHAKEKKGFSFIYQFSYGILKASVSFYLKYEDANVISLCLFDITDEKEYAKAEKGLEDAMNKMESDCTEERIAYYEKKIAELRG